MLVLTRKAGESIIIGDDIELMVLHIDGDHIKIGIKAPRSVSIYRSELWAEIQRENQLAVSKPAAIGSALAAIAASPAPVHGPNEAKPVAVVRMRQ